MLGMIDGFSIGNFNVKFYGILMALAMAIGVFVACKNAKYRGLKSENILILACYVLPLAVIGARIYYVLFNLDYYRAMGFVEAFKIWNGGLAIYGGVIGGALAIGVYCLIHKKNFLDVADVVVPSLILGQAIGRWGNFFNQEAYGGLVTNPKLQWFPFSVFIEDIGEWHLATFFYEFLFNAVIFVFLMLMLRKWKIRERGIIMAGYLAMYGLVRMCVEQLRTDSLYWGSLRVSQVLSGILFVCAIVYIITIYILKWKGKKIPRYEGIIENKKPKDVNK